MSNPNQKAESLRERCRPLFTIESLITVLTFALIAVFHRSLHEDRMLLNLYYVSVAAASYALVRRQAFACLAFVFTLAAATTLGHVYFATKRQLFNPLLDPVVDVTSLIVVLILIWRLTISASRYELEQRKQQFLRESEKRSVATRAAALAATSHEVRQPLGAILSITEALSDGTAGSLNEMQQEFVKDIDDCGKHLLALINDILDYAKTQSGLLKLQVETIALHQLIDQCVTISETSNTKSGLEIVKQLDPDAREVSADPLRFKQILLNLLSNALKFSNDGGVIRVQVRRENDEIVLSVRDSGRGISPDKFEHLFDPYYQAAHTDQGIGTGLGLAITKQLVEMHGGTISVESVVNSGTLFTVRFPSQPASNSRTWSQDSQEHPLLNVAMETEEFADHPEPAMV